jgi:hypothetical protein
MPAESQLSSLQVLLAPDVAFSADITPVRSADTIHMSELTVWPGCEGADHIAATYVRACGNKLTALGDRRL